MSLALKLRLLVHSEGEEEDSDSSVETVGALSDLCAAERDMLARYAGLAQAYGYVDAKQGGGRNWELESHTGKRDVQYLTDPVFRNLAKLYSGEPVLTWDTTLFYANSVFGQDILYNNRELSEFCEDLSSLEEVRQFLQEFVDSHSQIRELAALHRKPSATTSYSFAIITGMAGVICDFVDDPSSIPTT